MPNPPPDIPAVSYDAWRAAILSIPIGAHIQCAVGDRTPKNPRRWSWGIGQHPARLAALVEPAKHPGTKSGEGILTRWARWGVTGAFLHRPYGELAIDGEPMRFDALGPTSGTSDAEEEAIRNGMLAVDSWARDRNLTIVAYLGAMTRSPVLAEYALLDAKTEQSPIDPARSINQAGLGWSEPALLALGWVGRALGILNALDWDIGIDASSKPVSDLATRLLVTLRDACRSQGRRLLVEGPLPLAHAAMLVRDLRLGGWHGQPSVEIIGPECVWSIRSMRAVRAHGSKGLPARHAMIDALCQGHPIVVDGIPHYPDEAAILAYLAYESAARNQPTRMWAIRALDQHADIASMRERALNLAALWRTMNGHPATNGWEWWTITPETPARKA